MNDMNEANKEQLSAFMDGETDGQRQDLVDQMLKDPELMGAWSRYHLVSDCLRQCLPERIDKELAGNISQALLKEPAILAPDRRAYPFVKPIAGFAIAASVAALAILGIQQQQVGGPHEIPQDTLVQGAPGGAGSAYAPVRQVSSSGAAITGECDAQPDAGNREKRTRNRADDAEAGENCR